MEFIYAVKTPQELSDYMKYHSDIDNKLSDYIDFLKREYSVLELPKSIVLTSKEIATGLISDIPVPAYTNDHRVVFCPDIEVWRSIYLSQLESYMNDPLYSSTAAEIANSYSKDLSKNCILAILGHELAHHSELFLNDFSSDLSDGVWFEEGMVEYISRKYFLTEDEFKAQKSINIRLVKLYKAKYGCGSIEVFGSSTYNNDYAGIFFEYWRSFLAVSKLVDSFGGDTMAVFSSYAKWAINPGGKSLSEWFGIDKDL